MPHETTPLIHSPLLSQENPEGFPGKNATKEEGEFHIDSLFFSVALLGIFVALVDESFVLSTHDMIASSFHQAYLGPWLLSGYSLGYFISLPIYGRLSRIYGHKNPLLVSYLIFPAGCAMTGTAPSIWVAVAGRVIAGAGASGMVDLITIVINDMVPLSELAVYRGYITLSCMTGVSTGAPLGGFLAAQIGWRWSFIVQIPVGLLCFVMALWRLPSNATSDPSNSSQQQKMCVSQIRRLDIPGLVFLGIIMTALTLLYRFIGEQSWQDTNMVGFLIALIFFSSVGFVINEKFWAGDPIVPLWLLKTNGLGVRFLVLILLTLSPYAIMVKLTEYLVRVENVKESVASIGLLPIILASAVGSVLSGNVIKRAKRYKRPSVVFLAISIIFLLAITLRWRYRVGLWELSYVFVGITAMAVGFSAQFVGLCASAPEGHSATVITIYYLCQQLAFILTVTITATLSRRLFENALLRDLGTSEEAIKIIETVLNDAKAVYTMPDSLQRIVQASFLEGFQTIPVLSLCTATLALLLALCLKEHSIE